MIPERHYPTDNNYELVLPILYRDKFKYFYVVGLCNRSDGPAYIEHTSREWFINDDEVTDLVEGWCNLHKCDIDDLTEREILIMWAEISL